MSSAPTRASSAGASKPSGRMRRIRTRGQQWLSRVWGPFEFIVSLAILNSALANANAGVNAASRVLFAMGRIRALPGILSRVNRFRTPAIAIIFTMIVAVLRPSGPASCTAPPWLSTCWEPLSAFPSSLCTWQPVWPCHSSTDASIAVSSISAGTSSYRPSVHRACHRVVLPVCSLASRTI